MPCLKGCQKCYQVRFKGTFLTRKLLPVGAYLVPLATGIILLGAYIVDIEVLPDFEENKDDKN